MLLITISEDSGYIISIKRDLNSYPHTLISVLRLGTRNRRFQRFKTWFNTGFSCNAFSSLLKKKEVNCRHIAPYFHFHTNEFKILVYGKQVSMRCCWDVLYKCMFHSATILVCVCNALACTMISQKRNQYSTVLVVYSITVGALDYLHEIYTLPFLCLACWIYLKVVSATLYWCHIS